MSIYECCLQAFQVLSEYLQVLDYFSGLTAVQEMSRGVEVNLFFMLNGLPIFLVGLSLYRQSYVKVMCAANRLLYDICKLFREYLTHTFKCCFSFS